MPPEGANQGLIASRDFLHWLASGGPAWPCRLCHLGSLYFSPNVDGWAIGRDSSYCAFPLLRDTPLCMGISESRTTPKRAWDETRDEKSPRCAFWQSVFAIFNHERIGSFLRPECGGWFMSWQKDHETYMFSLLHCAHCIGMELHARRSAKMPSRRRFHKYAAIQGTAKEALIPKILILGSVHPYPRKAMCACVGGAVVVEFLNSRPPQWTSKSLLLPAPASRGYAHHPELSLTG